jgi:outer membrane protein OmpA-like peptidoglycan-associated protein
MHKTSLILICLSALSLSACGTWLDQQQPQVDVYMRADNGSVLAPLPPTLRTEGVPYVTSNSSVDVLDYQNVAPMQNNYIPAMNDVPMPMINEGFSHGAGVLTSDSSVTIFPLDGDVPPIAQSYGLTPSAQMQSAYDTGYTSAMPSYGSTEGKIFFKHGSSRLGSGDLNKLSNVAEQARFAPVNRITVEGFASNPTQAGNQSVKSHILNLKESMNRSFAVSKTLMQKGVPAEKLKTVSWGSTKASGNENQDRRVDVTMGER